MNGICPKSRSYGCFYVQQSYVELPTCRLRRQRQQGRLRKVTTFDPLRHISPPCSTHFNASLPNYLNVFLIVAIFQAFEDSIFFISFSALLWIVFIFAPVGNCSRSFLAQRANGFRFRCSFIRYKDIIWSNVVLFNFNNISYNLALNLHKFQQIFHWICYNLLENFI